MLTSIFRQACSQKRKEKRPFSLEENPAYVPPEQENELLSSSLICPLCKKLIKEAVRTTCCRHSYCNECIATELFDSGSQKCPNCGVSVKDYDSALVDDPAMQRAVMGWLSGSRCLLKSDCNVKISPTGNVSNTNTVAKTSCSAPFGWSNSMMVKQYMSSRFGNNRHIANRVRFQRGIKFR